MLSAFQKAAAWDKAPSELSLHEKLYVENPSEYEESANGGFDIEKLGAMQHQAAWPDVVQKARSIRSQNGILWFTKKPHDPMQPSGIVKVEGMVSVTAVDSTTHARQNYLCQIYFPHPLSRSCFGWACQCRWHDFVWQRRRFYGRFCSHALALYQATKTADVDYSDVEKSVYDASLPDLIEENRLSPNQLAAQIARSRRRLAPSQFMSDEDVAKFYKDAEDVLAQMKEEDEYGKDYFGENFEKILNPWDEENWGLEEAPSLSRYDNDRTKELRRKIKVERSKYNAAYEDYEWMLDKIDSLVEERQKWNELARELSDNLRKPESEKRDAKEIWESFGFSYSGKSVREEARRITENANKLRQQVKIAEKRLDDYENGIEALKQELVSALQENKYIVNTKRISDDMILDMIDQLHSIRPEKAYQFLKRFETGIESGGDRQSFAEILVREYAASLRQYMKSHPNFKPSELPEGMEDYELLPGSKDVKEIIDRPEDFAPKPEKPTQEVEQISREPVTVEKPILNEEGSDTGKTEVKNYIKVVERIWQLDSEGNRQPDPVTRSYYLDPTQKRSSVSVLSSDVPIRDIVIYLQRELANKNNPKCYTRRDVWGELRGGLCPHPDALPAAEREKNKIFLYNPDDLGYDPENGIMGSQEEDRGLYGMIPLGEMVDILSVDPSSRMILIRHMLESERPNHTHIDLWLPLGDIDLI
jgi:hypothetical protein